MEDDIVGYFKQVERFDYITIDLDKDEIIIAGNVKQYNPSRLEQLIQSFKRTAHKHAWNIIYEVLKNFLHFGKKIDHQKNGYFLYKSI